MSTFFILVENSAKTILILSTGVLSGLCVSISSVCLPAILGCNDPLTSWKIMYGAGMPIALPSMISGIISSIICILFSAKLNYLLIGGLLGAFFPMAQVYMSPLADQLFKLEEVGRDKDKERIVTNLIRRWSVYQFTRSLLSMGAFVLTIYMTIWDE